MVLCGWFCVVKSNFWRSQILVDVGFEMDTQFENVQAAMDEATKSG